MMETLKPFMDRFKAGIFEILSNSMAGETSIRNWYRQLTALLIQEFDIEKTFYLYKNDRQLYVFNESEKIRLADSLDILNKMQDEPFVKAGSGLHYLVEGDILIPCYDGDVLMGIVGLRPVPDAKWVQDNKLLTVMACDITVLYQNVRKMIATSTERKRYHELFEVTEAFNSIMDVNEILGKIINSLKSTFPQHSFTLLLSDEYDKQTDLPIEYLDYQTENPAIMHAFVSSELSYDDQGSPAALYSPLKGKQGVYGLLKTVKKSQVPFKDHEQEFIKVLSLTAGNALENAKLYQQSRRLIEDLSLINDLSHQLNSNLNMKEMMNYLHKQLRTCLKPSKIGFVLTDQNELKVLDGSCDFFYKQESQEYMLNLKNQFEDGAEAVYTADYQGSLSKQPVYRSVMAVPMVHLNELKGFCVVLHEQPYSFSFDMFKLFKSIIHHSALALINSMLRAEMQEMINRDHLTKLYSRHYLDQFVERSIDQDECGVFVLIDIDNFKKVNDTHGHQVGDQVIIQLARLLSSFENDSSISARWGGEELALYFRNLTLEEGIELTDSIRMSAPQHTDPAITISCGVAGWKAGQGFSMINLVKRADIALYESKNTGKNKVSYASGDAVRIY
ncbi:sensor domain-containing diguanylate cyclase [Jeotgalibacillus sp. R-1-5s-1]|uniref:sensor domain-containing diguanylate cyclase n=1 Tax=Jeotgalibacillus sp. R-1-5s-1 TaxID=2555897 RepID=UPI001069AB5E|nr:sensor domain-containing diguanylate cyclase [Jeotgalibacillus sp. R-1-5s-1]TFD98206.1 diguanylate cyclase [Jeotgalibacillus sp. R-1-5s-1]